MTKYLILSLFSFLILVLVSCEDTTNVPDDTNTDTGKYLFYTKVEMNAEKIQIRRFNLETNDDEPFKDSSVVLGIAVNKVYYMNVNMTTAKLAIWNCDPSGKNEFKLSSWDAQSFSTPILSADGSKFLYFTGNGNETKGFNIHCTNTNGTNDKIIYSSNNEWDGEQIAALSADAKKIGIVEQSYNAAYLITCNSDGTNLKMENFIHGFGDMKGGFSPDGMSFAYNDLDNFDYDIEFDSANIAIFDFRTHQKKIITNDGIIGYKITWSPDGTKLAFYREPGKLFVINSDGTGLVQLTDIQMAPTFMWWADLHLAWSADSKQILFQVNGNEDFKYNNLNLVNVETKIMKTIVQNKTVWNAFFL